jgi:hypothetical protein
MGFESGTRIVGEFQMKYLVVTALLAAGVAAPAYSTAFDLEGVAPGTFSSVSVSDGGLDLTIVSTTGALVWVGNPSNPPLLGSVGVLGGTSPFTPLKWSFSAPLDAITFNFGDLGGDDDSPVLIEAFSSAGVLLGSATTNYEAGLATGKSLSLNFGGMSYFITSSSSANLNFNSLVWDIGSVTPASGAVPEPASWMMLIAGFALVGAGMRGRRATVRFA